MALVVGGSQGPRYLVRVLLKERCSHPGERREASASSWLATFVGPRADNRLIYQLTRFSFLGHLPLRRFLGSPPRPSFVPSHIYRVHPRVWISCDFQTRRIPSRHSPSVTKISSIRWLLSDFLRNSSFHSMYDWSAKRPLLLDHRLSPHAFHLARQCHSQRCIT